MCGGVSIDLITQHDYVICLLTISRLNTRLKSVAIHPRVRTRSADRLYRSIESSSYDQSTWNQTVRDDLAGIFARLAILETNIGKVLEERPKKVTVDQKSGRSLRRQQWFKLSCIYLFYYVHQSNILYLFFNTFYTPRQSEAWKYQENYIKASVTLILLTDTQHQINRVWNTGHETQHIRNLWTSSCYNLSEDKEIAFLHHHDSR